MADATSVSDAVPKSTPNITPPADILAVVEDQFYDVRKRLDAQLTRTAEIQQQLEGQRKEIAELRRTVNLAHGLLKELLAKIP